jgi:hypothetical protein
MQQKLPALVPPVVPPKETPSSTPAMTGPAGTWNPILATTRAKPAPTAATCPPDTDPDTPGPADQDRPEAGWAGNMAAAFDWHTGRIVYVDTLGETWTFDVCTNTWHRMNPTGAMIVFGGRDRRVNPYGAELVYDLDSDLTVALGGDRISVYDANTNTWTQAGVGFVGTGPGLIVIYPAGAAYDPISGLILAPCADELCAYDVDTDDWTLIGGPVPRDPVNSELLGYSQMIDRLIFDSGSDTTVLVDPRTGEATQISTDTPYVDLGWPNGVYGPAADSVYVSKDDVCGFDADSLTWSACFDPPAALKDGAGVFAMVGDPINQRLILISGLDDARESDVWAIDLENGGWTQLLEPANQ